MIACNISFTPYQQLVELQFNFAFMNQSQYNGIYSFMLFAKIIRQGIQSVKLPIVDITNFITKNGNYENDCKKIAEIFRKYGLAVIKDPRINVAQNDIFLDLMERYFPKRSKQFYQGNKTIDISPQTHFQTGLTHEYMQKFQNYIQEKSNLTEYNKAVTPLEAGFGPNWRFSWKVQRTKNVIPADFPQIESTLSDWGLNMKNCCLTVSQMLAIGLDLQFNFFLDIISKGSFILAPTAVDLERVKQGDVLVAFHRDFDMFTIHGKARFPGLFSWLNTGEKFMVQVPQGHFLIQAAKQLQWVTGGYITAGFHEVVYSKEVQEAKQKAKEKGKPLWRISSTMFCDSQSSVLLKPHKKFATQNSNKLYPPIKAGDLLQSQLNYMIELK